MTAVQGCATTNCEDKHSRVVPEPSVSITQDCESSAKYGAEAFLLLQYTFAVEVTPAAMKSLVTL